MAAHRCVLLRVCPGGGAVTGLGFRDVRTFPATPSAHLHTRSPWGLTSVQRNLPFYSSGPMHRVGRSPGVFGREDPRSREVLSDAVWCRGVSGAARLRRTVGRQRRVRSARQGTPRPGGGRTRGGGARGLHAPRSRVRSPCSGSWKRSGPPAGPRRPPGPRARGLRRARPAPPAS